MHRFALAAALAFAAPHAVEAQSAVASYTPDGPSAVARQVGRRAEARSPLERRISVKLDDASVGEALRAIAREAALSFAFSDDVLPAEHRVTANLANVRVRDALREVVRGTGLVYTVTRDGRVTVMPGKPAAVAAARVMGRVTDAENGQPVEGVYVSLDGTNIVTRTNADGRYLLRDVPAGVYHVTARSIGYTRMRVEITVVEDAIIGQDFALRRSLNKLNAVVTTGSVAETQMKAIPNDMSVITAEQIAERNITNVEQLFRGEVPGLFIEDQGYLSRNPMESRTPQVRGQTFLTGNPGQTSTLKTYIDGVLVADFSVVSQLDPQNIERVEIIAGPAASTMYGSGASDGVMQIFTKRGGYGAETRTTVELSTYAFDSPYMSNVVLSPLLSANVTGGTDAVSFNVGGRLEQHGEWVPNYGHLARNVSGSISWRGERVAVRANVGYEGPNRFNVVDWGAAFNQLLLHEGVANRAKLSPYSLIPSGVETHTETQRVGTTVVFDATRNWQHELTYGTSDYVYENTQTRPNFATVSDTLLSLATSTNRTTTLRYTNTWARPWPASLTTTLTSGVEHTNVLGEYMSASGVPRLRGSLSPRFTSVSRTDDKNTGYFAQGQLGIKDDLFFTAGVRLESNPDYGEDIDLRPAPRFGAAYTKEFGNVTAKLRGSYGWASRPPFAYQRDGQPSYISGQTATTTTWIHNLANTELLPAENRGAEYGADLFIGRWLSLSVTGVKSMGKNAIYSSLIRADTIELTPTTFRVDNYFHNANSGDVETIGGQAVARVSWRNFWVQSTYSSYSNIIRRLPRGQVLSGTLETWRVGNRITYIPSYDASTVIGYSGRNTQINLQSTSRGTMSGVDQAWSARNLVAIPDIVGPPLFGRTIIMGEWTKFSLNATQRITNDFTGFFSISNLTNNRVVETAIDNRRPEAGRVFRFGTRWTH